MEINDYEKYEKNIQRYIQCIQPKIRNPKTLQNQIKRFEKMYNNCDDKELKKILLIALEGSKKNFLNLFLYWGVDIDEM